jgi:hypothetical protein
MDQNQLEKNMQYLIYRGLVPKSRKNTAKEQITINAQAYQFIRNEFGIKGRFSENSDFFNHYSFKTEMSIGCSGDSVKAKKGTFQMRLGNRKRIKVNGSIYDCGSYYLTFRFMRIEM